MMVTLDVIKTHCDKMLISMLGFDNVDAWWNTPNKAFDMDTPKERWNERPHEVYVYLLNYLQR